MRSTFLASGRLAILAATLIASASPAFANSALIRTLSGTPKILVSGKTMTLKKGDSIPDNALVRTGPVDSVDIYFDEAGRVISLGPNSQMRIELATRSVFLERGQVVGNVRKSAENLPPISVKTARGVASVSRGDFVVNALEQQISVLSGAVTYQSTLGTGGTVTQITSGKTLTEATQAAPASVTPISPEVSTQLMRNVDRVASSTGPMRDSDIKAAAMGGKPVSPTAPKP